MAHLVGPIVIFLQEKFLANVETSNPLKKCYLLFDRKLFQNLGRILSRFYAISRPQTFFSVLRESQRNLRKCKQLRWIHFLRFLWLSLSTEKKVVFAGKTHEIFPNLPRIWQTFTFIEEEYIFTTTAMIFCSLLVTFWGNRD